MYNYMKRPYFSGENGEQHSRIAKNKMISRCTRAHGSPENFGPFTVIALRGLQPPQVSATTMQLVPPSGTQSAKMMFKSATPITESIKQCSHRQTPQQIQPGNLADLHRWHSLCTRPT